MLSILIPTYNRDEFLLRNLHLLAGFITETQLTDRVEILVSDNCSTDATRQLLAEFQGSTSIRLEIFNQPANVGLKANALFVLSKSTQPYIMYLGDDDYIERDYLTESLKLIEADPNLGAIIPNNYQVDIHLRGSFASLRERISETRRYEPSFKTLLAHSSKGSQLSGLVLRREGLLEKYVAKGVDNMYLFIYLLSVSILHGNTYLLVKYPVKVVQPVKKKDWNYGKDGLLNDVFDNFKHLPIDRGQRYLLELKTLYAQTMRYYFDFKRGNLFFIKNILSIWFPENASLYYKLTFPLTFTLSVALLPVRLLRKKITNQRRQADG